MYVCVSVACMCGVICVYILSSTHTYTHTHTHTHNVCVWRVMCILIGLFQKKMGARIDVKIYAQHTQKKLYVCAEIYEQKICACSV